MKRLQEGDVFEIDLGPHGFGYGQIIRPGIVFQASVLEGVFAEPQAASVLDAGSPVGFVWTTDGDFRRHIWRVIGSLPTPADVPQPRHKIASNGTMFVEDFHGAVVRPATSRDEAFYDFRLSVSSPRVSEFILAHHGLSTAEPDRRHYAAYQHERMADPPR